MTQLSSRRTLAKPSPLIAAITAAIAIPLSGCGGTGACDLYDPSVGARLCYDDYTEEECTTLGDKMQDESSQYPGQTCADRGCPGGHVCSSR